MIESIQKYQDFIMSIFKKIPIMKTKQSILCLVNGYEEIDENSALGILFSLQKKEYIFLSVDGWVMTQGFYKKISNDKKNIYVMNHEKKNNFEEDGVTKINNSVSLNVKNATQDYHYYLDSIIHVIDDDNSGVIAEKRIDECISQKQKEQIDCMWLIADMMPYSVDFFTNVSPWTMCFISEPEEEGMGKIYEIIYISEKKKDALIQALKSLEEIKSKKLRDCIRRIAIVENKEIAEEIPLIGFKFITEIDDKEEKNYSILSKMNVEESWSEYV